MQHIEAMQHFIIKSLSETSQSHYKLYLKYAQSVMNKTKSCKLERSKLMFTNSEKCLTHDISLQY